MNYMLPQSVVNHTDTQLKDYVNAMIESMFILTEHNVKAFDKLTGHTFSIHTSKIVDSTKDITENAKQIIKTGKFIYPSKG